MLKQGAEGLVPVWVEWVSAGQFGQLKPVEIALGGLHVCSELPALGTPTLLCSLQCWEFTPILILKSPHGLQGSPLTDVGLSWGVLDILVWKREGDHS